MFPLDDKERADKELSSVLFGHFHSILLDKHGGSVKNLGVIACSKPSLGVANLHTFDSHTYTICIHILIFCVL